MHVSSGSCLRKAIHSATSLFSLALVLAAVVLSCSPPAKALPAFARKYGLRCSACHESWPMLNYFGQKFKDNGYQLMNDRDSPIWQNPGYWPVTFRITPIWHRVSTGKVDIDTYSGGAISGSQIQRVTSSGFDLSGLDFHTGGVLEKNFSFYVLPSSDPTASFHFETVMARLDNLFGSSWLNVKLGKFELDNLLSEKRILTLTGNGGIYQLYHFIPVGDGNIFGQMGDNQLGVEVMGHSADDRTRYSASILSSSDGQVGLPYGNGYTGFFTGSQAFDAGRLGVQRVGFYAMVGEAPTYWLTQGGTLFTGQNGTESDSMYAVHATAPASSNWQIPMATRGRTEPRSMADADTLPIPMPTRNTARMMENVYTVAPSSRPSSRVQTTSAPSAVAPLMAMVT